MNYSFKTSYIRSIRRLERARVERVQNAFEQLVRLFENGERTPGLGLKQLRYELWEIRAGLLDRIVFRRRKDTVEFIIAGTHDEIKRLLRNI